MTWPTPFALGVEHPFLPTLAIGGYESKCRLNSSTKFVLAQPSCASLADRRENRGAQKRDEQKIIEMAGLERSILSIVGEAKQLAPVRRQ